MYGISKNGAAAEYMAVDSKWTVPLPDGVSFEAAAPLMCAGKDLYLARVTSLADENAN